MLKSTTLLGIVFLALAAMGSWLVFTAELSLDELVLGAACTVLAVAMHALAWRQMRLRFLPSFKQVVTAWPLPWYLLRDAFEITAILAKDITGARRAGSLYRATRFDVSSGRRGVAQVVLATVYTTMTPSVIVIGLRDDQMLFHQLERRPVPSTITDLEMQQ